MQIFWLKVYSLKAGITRRDYAESITRREMLGSQDTRDGTPSSGGLLTGATRREKGDGNTGCTGVTGREQRGKRRKLE